ncbi:hypothetical protein HZ989_13360 [Brevundimonas sp. AJA228-03]|uniref:hypothetical protein n=1 Tax=Brevundimonas sp. AJA228-03 TaxID=2752515 RepID=UPI001AE0D194|nr:hypothetical protein [Brevundimonas sp. AJA228-03]QTN19195.1 hypothetical protein HZ989_13360 [Brevundimonas sp. AJA228-03]
MRQTLFFIFACLAIIYTPACVQQPDQVKTITGELDSTFVDAIRRNANAGNDIVISSYGGDPAIGQEAALLVGSYPAKVSIGELCLSSCAEFILPTKAQLNFVGRPLIGFHGNDQIAVWLAEYYQWHTPVCGSERAQSQRTRFEELGWNVDFWKDVARRLLIISARDSGEYNCTSVVVSYDIAMWFPTSDQLQLYLNFSPRASICADDENCWRSRMSSVISPGSGFMVGDDIFLMSVDNKIVPLARAQFQRNYISP